MLDPALSPTRLVAPDERPPIPVAPQRPPNSTLRTLWLLMRWLTGAAVGRVRHGRISPEQIRGEQLIALLEALGGLWIKAGQLLAMRVDLFSQELCRDLSRLQTRGTAVPFGEARPILEADLGPLESVFDAFEEHPFAATWIAQLHRARLRREGVWVAVKIQRPGMARTFARDLAVMRWLVRGLVWLHLDDSVRWWRGLEELEQIAREEADFRFEAAAIERMRDNLPRRRIVVPDVFPDYCTSRVLVTEFIHAALMSDYIRLRREDPARLSAWLAANGIDPPRLARRLVFSFLRQLFEDNFYHGDLYPGNIVLLRDGRVALLHFAACSFTEREYLTKLRLFVRALATRDYAKAADLALLLCGQLPVIDVEEVKEELVRGLRAWASRTFVKGLPYDDKSIDNATVIVTRILLAHGCPMDWAFLRVRRALALLDASIVHLDPEIDYTRLCATYFRKAERRALTRALGRPLALRAAGSVVKALDLQDRLSEYTLFQGGIVRRHAQVFQGATDKLSELMSALLGQVSLVILAAAVFLGVVLIEQNAPGRVGPVLGPQLDGLVRRVPALGTWIGAAALGATLYAWMTVRRLRRRFREKDVKLPGTPVSV